MKIAQSYENQIPQSLLANQKKSLPMQIGTEGSVTLETISRCPIDVQDKAQIASDIGDGILQEASLEKTRSLGESQSLSDRKESDIDFEFLSETPAEIQKTAEETSSIADQIFEIAEPKTSASDIPVEVEAPVISESEDTINLAGFDALSAPLKEKATQLKATFDSLRPTIPPSLRSVFKDLESEIESIFTYSPEKETQAEYQSRVSDLCEHLGKKFAGVEEKIIGWTAVDLKIDMDTARKIFNGARSNWVGMYERSAQDNIQQKHTIPNLKIYENPNEEGSLVADYGKETLGEGSFKRAKDMIRLGLDAEDINLARLTSRENKKLERPITKEQYVANRRLERAFKADAEKEIKARKSLEGIKYITKMEKIIYQNERGEIKTRYVMKRYDRDLFSTIWEKHDLEKAKKACLTVFDGLVAMHARGYVHGDMKSENILLIGDEGFINDFGFLGQESSLVEFNGVLTYMAPETIFPQKKAHNMTHQWIYLALG